VRRMGIHVVPVVVLMVSWMAMLAGDPARAAGEEYEMTTYQFAMLVDGPERDAIQGEAAEDKQRQHVEFLTGLLDDGTALVAGPVEGAAPIRGIVVLTVDTVAAAEEILAADPWVKAGHLALEIHPWWAARDIILKAPDPLSHETCWLGLIRRPADAPELAEARLKELQKGHMANIQAMADSGDLVIAGPMGDDTALRGIFVFRTLDQDKVHALVEQDPSVQAGRLQVDLMRWYIPRGALPPAPE
jgi:uncharacterized protein YciI